MLRGLLFLFILLLVSPAKSQTNTPFLYYYSTSEAAFIIERADGTERRTLAEFSLLPDHSIVGPGWSPSGEWFAWATDISPTLSTDPEFSAWVINRSGTNLSPIHEGGQVLYLAWSTVSDVLMIVYADDENDNRLVLEIIDIQSNQSLFTEQIGIFYQWATTTYASWLPDGNHFAVYSATQRENIYSMRVFSVTGQLIGERRFAYQEEFSRYETLPAWSEDGKVIYLAPTEHTLVIDDFFSGDVQALPLEAETLAYVDWSPRGDFAMIYTGSLNDIDTLTLWLYDHEMHQISLLSDMPQPNYWNSRGGLVTAYPTSTWNMDGETAFFLDTAHRLYTLTPASREIREVTPPELSDWDVLPFNNVVWQDDGSLYFIVNHVSDTVLVQYLPEENLYNFIREDVSAFAIHYPFIAMTNCDVRHLFGCILNTDTMQEHPLQLDYPSYTVSSTGFLWHSSGDWAIMIGESVFGYGFLGVTDSMVENYRSLETSCRLNLSCYGWLPESVP